MIRASAATSEAFALTWMSRRVFAPHGCLLRSRTRARPVLSPSALAGDEPGSGRPFQLDMDEPLPGSAIHSSDVTFNPCFLAVR